MQTVVTVQKYYNSDTTHGSENRTKKGQYREAVMSGDVGIHLKADIDTRIAESSNGLDFENSHTQSSSYNVQMKCEDGVLRYFVTGHRSFQASYNLWQQIYDDCEKHKVNLVHATVILSGVLERMEIPLIIQKLISLNAERPITCAWVDHNHSSYLDNIIGERILRPETMNIRIFNNDKEAEDWLKTTSSQAISI